VRFGDPMYTECLDRRSRPGRWAVLSENGVITMKICPHCNQENPDDRMMCNNCGRPIRIETNKSKVINSLIFILIGIVLIIFDLGVDIYIFIPIPYALTLIGIFSIFIGIEGIYRIKKPLRRK
jgi:hypothetical protein